MYFKTERLEIKPISDGDQVAVIELLMDDAVKQTYMVPDFQSPEEAVRLFGRLKKLSAAEGHYVAGIFLGPALIGILNETEVSGSKIELGYAILPRYHNQGYGTEALTGAVGYLFDQGFGEIVAGAFEENRASIRVMVKSGMTKMSHQDEIRYRGSVHRCVYYSIRREADFTRLVELELLSERNIAAVRAIHREDISEEFVDSVDTIMEITQYGIDHQCKGHTYAVKYAGTYIGVILLGEAIPWETDPEEMKGVPFYRLMGFVLDNRYRNRGIGGYAVEAVIEMIYQEFGVRPIALGVHRDNHEAARFYVKHGFRKTGTMEGNDYYYLRYPSEQCPNKTDQRR